MTDEPIDPSVSAEYEGRRIWFCCKMCRKEFLAEPEAYIDAVPPPSAYAAYFGEPVAGSDDGAGDARVTEPAGDDPSGAGEANAGAEPEPAASSASAASPTSGGPRLPAAPGWKERLGRFHVTVVHFPIALLIVAAFAELLGRREVARFCLGLGALAASVAAGLGLIAEDYASYPTMTEIVFLHRWLGIATAIAAIAAWWLSRSADDPRRRTIYRTLLFLAALLVAITGHHGGSLIFGPDWLLG